MTICSTPRMLRVWRSLWHIVYRSYGFCASLPYNRVHIMLSEPLCGRITFSELVEKAQAISPCSLLTGLEHVEVISSSKCNLGDSTYVEVFKDLVVQDLREQSARWNVNMQLSKAHPMAWKGGCAYLPPGKTSPRIHAATSAFIRSRPYATAT